MAFGLRSAMPGQRQHRRADRRQPPRVNRGTVRLSSHPLFGASSLGVRVDQKSAMNDRVKPAAGSNDVRVPNIVDLRSQDRSTRNAAHASIESKSVRLAHLQFTPIVAHEAELVLDVDSAVG